MHARILLRLACVALMMIGAAAPVLAQSAGAKKVALVIGNAAYKEAPLKNPVNDARAMAAKLRELGFRVIAQENATKAQMEKSVLDFGESLGAGAVGLFYYAGHGLQVNGRNFLVPVDATMRSEQSVRLETLDVDILLDQMDVAKSSVNLVVLDACRNNPFERRLRSTGSGLAQINAPQGTLIAYATAPGKVAADGEGANGVYTARLLQHMGAPGLAIEEVFKRVRVDVGRETDGAQTPWESSSLTGRFSFVEPSPAIPPSVAAAPRPDPQAPAPAPAPQIDREALFWRSIGDSNDPGVLQAYLSQYPKGAFAPLARAKIAAIDRRRQEEQDRKARAQQLAAAPAPPRAPPAAPAPAAAPVPTAAPMPPPASATGRNGKWTGRDGDWTVEVQVANGRLSGTGRRGGGRAWTISATIDQGEDIAGIVTAPNGSSSFDAKIMGRFPTMEISSSSGPGARITLQPAP
jgi:hypothetical protein